MSGYILCQGKRARFPYYIENISTNIYTLEELCYYLNHNIYLLDETILNEELCRWILEELGLRKLYDKLYRMLDEKVPAGTFILPIFKEIHYLTMEEFRELNVRVQKLEQEPPLLRQKIMNLFENRQDKSPCRHPFRPASDTACHKASASPVPPGSTGTVPHLRSSHPRR